MARDEGSKKPTMTQKAHAKKGKKPHKNKLTSKKYVFYAVSGDRISVNPNSCPRCGPGVFLANHKTRLYCGKCHFTKFLETA